MIEQFGPAADAQVEYLQERARSSYHQRAHHPGAAEHETLLHWVRRHTHVSGASRT
jgi:hypothetical protein